MKHEILSVGFKPGQEGSIDGFEAVCSCGYRLSSAFLSMASNDLKAQVAYMVAKETAR